MKPTYSDKELIVALLSKADGERWDLKSDMEGGYYYKVYNTYREGRVFVPFAQANRVARIIDQILGPRTFVELT